MLPKYVVKEYGDGIRSDIGSLGAGIYFSDNVALSLKYCDLESTNGRALICVCEVALGATKEYYDYNYELDKAPDGFQSTHGVKHTDQMASKFTENEYVIYNTAQYRIKYLVELKTNDALHDKR